MKKDLQGRVFQPGNSIAYVGFDHKIHLGVAILKDKKLVLELEDKIGTSRLSDECLIIY